MRKAVIQALKFLVFLAVGILLLWFAFRNVEFNKLVAGLKEANYAWLILSVFFSFLAFLSRARRWILLIQPLGHNPAFSHTFHAMMSGYLANLALPRIGEITRCVALGRKEKIPVDQLIGTVVVERAIDLVSLLIIMTVVIFTSGELINKFLKESIFIPLQEKVFSIPGISRISAILFVIISVIILFLIIKYRKELRSISLLSKIFDIARGVFNGLKTIVRMKRKREFLLHTVFIWINYLLMTWVVVFAIYSTSHLTLIDAVFLLVIGGVAMSVPVPSGIGAFHYIISRGFALVQGVNLEDGALYAILTHESQLVFILILGAVSFYIMFGKHHNIDPQSS